jgi:hypothetical protein
MNRILFICVCFAVFLLAGCSTQMGEKITDTTNYNDAAQTTPSHDEKSSPPDNNQVNDDSRLFELVTIDSAPIEVKEWLQREFQDAGWSKRFLHSSGNTYVLLKTSSSNKDSIELEDVKFEGEKVLVLYQTFSYHETKPNLKDYLLIKINGELKVGYRVTYTTEQ